MNQKQQPPIKITLEENLVGITFGVEHAHYLFWETERLLGRFGDHEDRVKMKAKEFMDFLQEESEIPIILSGSVEQTIKRIEQACEDAHQSRGKAWRKLSVIGRISKEGRERKESLGRGIS